MKEQSISQSLSDESECLYVFGKCSNENLKFLVDSGASHNFLPSLFVSRRSFREERGPLVSVRLANGTLLRTNRFCFLWVNFGEVSSYLKFTVLPCECPMILGMPFLRRLNPLINWQTRTLSFA